jgi:hypothetical protein
LKLLWGLKTNYVWALRDVSHGFFYWHQSSLLSLSISLSHSGLSLSTHTNMCIRTHTHTHTHTTHTHTHTHDFCCAYVHVL